MQLGRSSLRIANHTSNKLGSLSKGVFEQRTSTGSKLFAVHGQRLSQHFRADRLCRLKIGAATLPILSMGKWLLPSGKQRLLCDRFSQGEIASGKFPWIHQSEQKNYP